MVNRRKALREPEATPKGLMEPDQKLVRRHHGVAAGDGRRHPSVAMGSVTTMTSTSPRDRPSAADRALRDIAVNRN